MRRTLLSIGLSCICLPLLVAAVPLERPPPKEESLHFNETRVLHKREDLAARKAKVLNFFSVPPNRECLSDDKRRSGICFNPYECKIQNGEARGQCSRGYGVCCVFTATCGDEIKNNITYFVNPGFPGLHSELMECEIKVKKMASHVSQIRLDFEHFNLGQPNRRTGNCDSDVFIMGATSSKKKNTLKFPSREIRLCGQNSGHHVYYDVENFDEPLTIRMDLKKENIRRLWEIKVTQVRFNQRAPSGCMQYYRGTSGMIQTMNFAENGRHLANQDYTICMRQEEGFCSIAYEPCDENSFKIGPPPPGGAGPLGGAGSLGGAGPLGTNPLGGGPLLGSPPGTNPLLGFPGEGGGVEPVVAEDDPIFGDDAGSGFEGFFRTEEEVNSIARQGLAQGGCADRIVMPCDSEEFIAADPNGPGVCDLLHCGSSFCNSGEDPCRIESSTTPFHIQVLFGPGVREESPDDNLGMCLRYEQLPCI